MNMKNKVAIIGAGQVGSTLAYTLYNLNMCDILLLNHNKQKAVSNVIDIMDCSVISKRGSIKYGTYKDLDDVDIIVNCAGNSSLLKICDRNGELENSKRIAQDILNNINATNFKGIFINVMNPCDDITYIFRDLNLPYNHIIGTGTSLETCRLRSLTYSIYHNITESYVIGKHGDFNDIVCKDVLLDINSDILDNMMRLVKQRVWNIYSGKGYTNFGICNILIEIITNIIYDTGTIMCLSTLYGDLYTIFNQAVSLPCRLGKDGITEVVFDKDAKIVIDKLYGGES